MYPTGTPDPITVRIGFDRRGVPEVARSDLDAKVRGETLDHAGPGARVCGAHGGPCELPVRDLHRRVLRRELHDGHGGSADLQSAPKGS